MSHHEDDLKPGQKIESKAQSLGIGSLERHIFLCIGPDCCPFKHGAKTWDYLKARLKELKLATVYRSKASCLRLCRQGPIAVVYPEGAWYCNVSPEVCEQIIQQHLIGGQVVEEFLFALNPLPVESPSSLPKTARRNPKAAPGAP